MLRALRLLRSYRVLRDLRCRFPFFARNQQVIQAITNLLIFVFVVTALVFITQHSRHSHIQSYIDALYFTVTTLTTTGYGDIVLTGQAGRLLAVLIMFAGIGLFLRWSRRSSVPIRSSSAARTAGSFGMISTRCIASTAAAC